MEQAPSHPLAISKADNLAVTARATTENIFYTLSLEDFIAYNQWGALGALYMWLYPTLCPPSSIPTWRRADLSEQVRLVHGWTWMKQPEKGHMHQHVSRTWFASSGGRCSGGFRIDLVLSSLHRTLCEFLGSRSSSPASQRSLSLITARP